VGAKGGPPKKGHWGEQDTAVSRMGLLGPRRGMKNVKRDPKIGNGKFNWRETMKFSGVGGEGQNERINTTRKRAEGQHYVNVRIRPIEIPGKRNRAVSNVFRAVERKRERVKRIQAGL